MYVSKKCLVWGILRAHKGSDLFFLQIFCQGSLLSVNDWAQMVSSPGVDRNHFLHPVDVWKTLCCCSLSHRCDWNKPVWEGCMQNLITLLLWESRLNIENTFFSLPPPTPLQIIPMKNSPASFLSVLPLKEIAMHHTEWLWSCQGDRTGSNLCEWGFWIILKTELKLLQWSFF